jgi:peptidoglycan/xylan/chitin deacetylase (PgdA/CDA1 family)
MALPPNPVPRTVRVPILTYHRVHLFATELTKSVPDLTVEPTVFRSEMAALARHGYHTVSQHQLYEALFHGRPLPTKPVMITVDDGYIDDVTQILPVLRAHRMVATFYIITGRLHEQGFLNPTQVRELDAAGMDVGAHTRTHASLPALTLSARHSEIDGSRRDLERLLGHPVYSFAYPYGAENASVVGAVRRAGFVLAVTTQGGTHESSLASLTMPRIHVGRSGTAATVLAAAGG